MISAVILIINQSLVTDNPELSKSHDHKNHCPLCKPKPRTQDTHAGSYMGGPYTEAYTHTPLKVTYVDGASVQDTVVQHYRMSKLQQTVDNTTNTQTND